MALTNPQQRGRLIGPPPPRPPQAGQQQQPVQPVGQPQTQPAVQPQPSQPSQPVVQSQSRPTGYALGSALTQTNTPPPTSYPTGQNPPPPQVTAGGVDLPPPTGSPFPPSTQPLMPPGTNDSIPNPNFLPTPQLNQYGTYATPEQIAEALAAGETPFSMLGYTPPAPGVGGAVGGMSAPVTYIGNTGQTVSPEEYDKIVASGGHYTPPDSALGPAQWGPGGSPLPSDMFEITPDMIAENQAYWQGVYGQNQGGPATQAQIDAAPHTPPGTTFPNVGNPAVEAPWMGGPEQQYGPGTAINGTTLPDSYGYIRTEEDPFGLDDEYQQELQDLLSGQINSGLGTTQWNAADPFSPLPTGGQSPSEGQGGYGGTEPQEPDYIEEEAEQPAPPTGGDAGEFEIPEAPEVERPEFDMDFETPDPMDIFNQSADALEARLQRSREQGMRGISERASERGILGGSPELGMVRDLESELGVQAQEGYSALARERQQFGLQNRAQELQKYGIDSELSYQYAALEQDSGFRQTALELQSRGMDMDEAYRYSAMAQDARFRQIALDLQSRGLDMDEAYRQAALTWEKERFGTEVGLQQEGLGLERDRFRAWIQQMLYDQGIEAEDVPPWLEELMGGEAGGFSQPPTPQGLTPEQQASWDEMMRIMRLAHERAQAQSRGR